MTRARTHLLRYRSPTHKPLHLDDFSMTSYSVKKRLGLSLLSQEYLERDVNGTKQFYNPPRESFESSTINPQKTDTASLFSHVWLNEYIKILLSPLYYIYIYIGTQGRTNVAPNETRTHSSRFASLVCKTTQRALIYTYIKLICKTQGVINVTQPGWSMTCS